MVYYDLLGMCLPLAECHGMLWHFVACRGTWNCHHPIAVSMVAIRHASPRHQLSLGKKGTFQPRQLAIAEEYRNKIRHMEREWMCNSRKFPCSTLFLLEHASSSPRVWHLPVQKTYHDHYTWTYKQIIQSTESSLQQDTLHWCAMKTEESEQECKDILGSSWIYVVAETCCTCFGYDIPSSRHTLYRMEMAHEKSRHTASRITVQAVSYDCTGEGEQLIPQLLQTGPTMGQLIKHLLFFCDSSSWDASMAPWASWGNKGWSHKCPETCDLITMRLLKF